MQKTKGQNCFRSMMNLIRCLRLRNRNNALRPPLLFTNRWEKINSAVPIGTDVKTGVSKNVRASAM